MSRGLALGVLALAGCAPVSTVDGPTRAALWSAGRVCEERVHGTVRLHEIDNYGRLRFSYRWENERSAFQRCVQEQLAERLPPGPR
jgi:hypothetical protein